MLHDAEAARRVFDCEDVKKRVHDILHEQLHDKQNASQTSSSLGKDLAGRIKETLKTCGYERYKLIVQVIVCQQYDEHLHMASRAYWDSDTDKFAQSIYVNQRLMCVATVFAVFYYG